MTQENMEAMSEKALAGIRRSIGLFPDEVLRKVADPMDTLIHERGASPATDEWTGAMMTVLGMLDNTSHLLALGLRAGLESTPCSVNCW